MKWKKTLRRLARKRGFTVHDIANKTGYARYDGFSNVFSKPKTKIAADALEIPEEIFLLEALRDSTNLPDHTRMQIINIINELTHNSGE